MSSGRSPQQIEREIEQTREELGETVEALAAKTDVKEAARRKLAGARAKAPVVAVFAAAGALAGGVVLLRRRSAQRRAARRSGLAQRLAELL